MFFKNEQIANFYNFFKHGFSNKKTGFVFLILVITTLFLYVLILPYFLVEPALLFLHNKDFIVAHIDKLEGTILLYSLTALSYTVLATISISFLVVLLSIIKNGSIINGFRQSFKTFINKKSLFLFYGFGFALDILFLIYALYI